jgi:HD superfamily phosphohydrolase
MTLEDRVAEFVDRYLGVYRPPKVRGRKAIHDTVWGTNLFHEHEIAVLNTPLLQRLRRIFQTGLAFLTYPSATHTRFEHTLGVTVMASRFVEKVNEKYPATRPLIDPDHQKGDLAAIRMAALMHDSGHGFFSHISEEVYQWDHSLQHYLKQDRFAHCKASEILAYLIVKSQPFQRWFEDHVRDPYAVRIDPNFVADLIIGVPPLGNRRKGFLAKIINGAFDADKLDYIARHSHFTGLKLTVDMERLFYTVSTHDDDSDQGPQLVVESPTPLEQLLFSKMMLFSTVYHHQKVKACDAMLHGMVEYAQFSGQGFRGNPLRDPVDFMSLTDHDILSDIDRGSTPADRLASSISRRNLFKRALVISSDTVDNYDANFYRLTRIGESPKHITNLRMEIHTAIAAPTCSFHEIWASFPLIPSLREATQALVAVPGGKPVPLHQYFPVDGWLTAYAVRQWKGHVFSPPGMEAATHEAAKRILGQGEWRLDLNDKSRVFCHPDGW